MSHSECTWATLLLLSLLTFNPRISTFVFAESSIHNSVIMSLGITLWIELKWSYNFTLTFFRMRVVIIVGVKMMLQVFLQLLMFWRSMWKGIAALMMNVELIVVCVKILEKLASVGSLIFMLQNKHIAASRSEGGEQSLIFFLCHRVLE